MALADILQAMEQEVAAEVGAIAERAAAEAAQIRAAAEQEAAATRARLRDEALLPIQHERARRLNRARLDALRHESEARERLFGEALERARARLEQARAEPGYRELLRALAAEALAGIGGPSTLRADPRDERELRALFPDTPLTCDLRGWGGVEARTPDGRIVVTNTLEARLEQARARARLAVMPLFETEAEPWATMTMPMLAFAR